MKELAESTGGRFVANTKDNNPEIEVPHLMEEARAQYTIRFRASEGAPRDTFRRVEVTVRRPGLQICTRTGYFVGNTSSVVASGAPSSLATPSTPSSPTAPSPLAESLGGLLPVSDTPMQLALTPLALEGKPGGTVVATVRLRHPASSDPAKQTVSLLAHAYDKEGRSHASRSVSLRVAPSSPERLEVDYDVALRLDLEPGRYEVRIGADSGTAWRGSVFQSVDVPPFARDEVSMAGLVFQASARPRMAYRDTLPAGLPGAPTTMREFLRQDRVAVHTRLYQRERRQASAAQVTTSLTDARDAVVFQEKTEIEPTRFEGRAGAPYTIQLPLERLAPGEYLIRVEAVIGDTRVVRSTRFTVLQSRAERQPESS